MTVNYESLKILEANRIQNELHAKVSIAERELTITTIGGANLSYLSLTNAQLILDLPTFPKFETLEKFFNKKVLNN